MVFQKLKYFYKKHREKKKSLKESSNLTNDGVERTETGTSHSAVRNQPVPTVSTGEQSTASQGKEKSTATNSKNKDELGVNILCPGKDPVVDIIFLHGLTGKRDSTWTCAGSEKPWPEALLGNDIEKARIITYGYDADVVHLTKPAGQNTIRQHSSNLLLDLDNLRGKKPSSRGRSIIFVVHSLGGLVVEDAIFYSDNHPAEAYTDISKSTKGVVFFGTPHAGSGFTKFAEALANLIHISFVKKPNKLLLEVLNRNSAMLANIENDFMGLVRKRARDKHKEIDLFAFLESVPVPATGHRVVTPESATITGYSFASIDDDHMGMTKFASRNADYERVQGVLDGWVERLEPNSVQEETGDSSPHKPNDVNFGREIYFHNRRSVVKNHTRRSKLLQIINKQFDAREENRSSVVILQALGGQGKTQLAIDYCYQMWKKRQYYAVFFLNASSEQTLRGEMISLVDALKSPAQIFDNDDHKFLFVLSKIKSWNRPWLLVLDNYDKPQTFPNIDRDYIPHTNHGNILVTTRHQALDELGQTLTVPPMLPEEAADLLIKASGMLDRTSRTTPGLTPNEYGSAIDIVNRLERLPLAVHQAAAYIRYKELDLTDFMEDYDSRKTAIWNRKPELWGYGHTVYTTWELSYDLIDVEKESRQRKGALLTMLAFLDSRSISRELFDVPRAVQNLEALRSQVLDLVDPLWLREVLRRDGNWDILQVEDRLDLFRDLSLLQIMGRSNRKAYKISFHPLVADWVKYRLHSDKLTEHQCLFQASVLVLACLKDQARSEVASLLSEQAREEVMRHQTACITMLNKLREEDSSSTFALAIETILKDIQEVPKLIQESRDRRSSQHRRNVLKWLSPNSQAEVYLRHQRSKVAGTCDWINHTDAFVQWEAGQASVLLINGPAGSGKSVLMASIAEKLLHKRNKSDPRLEAVAFCFVQFHDFGAWSATHVLRAFLQQILNRQEHIPSIVGDMFKWAVTHGKEPSIAELQNALALAIKDVEEVWILVDALDQLDDRTSLIEALVELVTQASQNRNIHIAFASRDVPYHVEQAISSFKWINTTRIDITPDQVEDDIWKFVRAFMEQHPKEKQARNDWIDLDPRAIVNKANGSFLWARLVLDEMISNPNHAYLSRQLPTSTSSLNHVYDQTLEMTGHDGKELVRWTLAFLCHAVRPVSGLEVQYAVASLVSESTLVSFSKDRSDTLLDIDTIVEQCSGLVNSDTETGILAVSHDSVREWYLDTQRPKWTPGLHADSDIARTCLSHFFRLSSVQITLQDQFLTYPLLSYSASYWAHHTSRKPDEGLIRKFLLSSMVVAYWLRVLRADKVAQVQTVHASASVEELEEILPGLMEQKAKSVEAFAKKLGFQLHGV